MLMKLQFMLSLHRAVSILSCTHAAQTCLVVTFY